MHELAPYLPDLHRYARILTGSQNLGDALVSLTLEDAEFESTHGPVDKLKLYQLMSRIWSGPVGSHWRSSERTRAASRQLTQLTPRSRQAYLLVPIERLQPSAVAEILEMPVSELQQCLKEAQEQIAAQGAARVLIIEDEALIAVELENIVTSLGHEVVGISRTRDAAVTKSRQTRPSLILSDIKLADGSSGVDAVAEITKTREIPAIFITAYPERLLTGLRREPVFLITKPFRAETVRALIGQALFWTFDHPQATDA